MDAGMVDDTRDPERVETVVIGAGQAGLAVGHHLRRRRRRFVILEAGARIGDPWRTRWDGLRLFTPARYDALPGMAFPAKGSYLPTKDEVADYVESYATRMDLPVETGMRVDGLWGADDGHGFVVAAGGRRFEADQVVVATGAYHAPRIPAFAADLAPSIRQLHSSRFRDASQLRDGGVLIVGASNSGAEIAMIAARDHATVLAGPDKGKMPVRPESRLAQAFDLPFWFFINHIATTRNPIGRAALPMVRDHGGPLERIWPSDLTAAGVERVVAKAVAADDRGRPKLDDGRVLDVANIVWCTGYRPDFAWIRLPILGEDGWPLHDRGVVRSVPGLYVVGLPFLFSAASALLGGVGRDAAYIADRIVARAGAVEPDRAAASAPITG